MESMHVRNQHLNECSIEIGVNSRVNAQLLLLQNVRAASFTELCDPPR